MWRSIIHIIPQTGNYRLGSTFLYLIDNSCDQEFILHFPIPTKLVDRIGSWIADYAIHACVRIFLIVAINFVSTRRRKYLHVQTYVRILENSQGFTDTNHISVSPRTILVVTVIISTGFISNLLGSFLNLRIHRSSKITTREHFEISTSVSHMRLLIILAK